MNEKYIEEKFKQIEKTNDNHEERISELEKTYVIMQKMDLRVSNIEKSVGTINEKLDTQTNDKGKKWDKLVDYLFYFLISILLGLLVAKLGLK